MRETRSPSARAARRSLLALALAACAAGPGGTTGPGHPLAGRIWQVSEARFASEAELMGVLAARRYVLLGEVHDNAEHHRLQSRVIEGLAARGRRPALVLEMIRRGDQAEALEAALSKPGVSAADVRRAVDWDASGWPAWELYAPVFERALARGLPIVAGDLSTAERKALRSGGIAALAPADVASLGLDTPLPPETRATLEADLREGHCNLLPESSLPAMIDFQRARDARLARSLVDAARPDPDGAVLVAGAGHVRLDTGVPRYLARFDPGASLASVGLVEVRAGESDPAHDLAGRFDGPAPFDYVWFTSAAAREDPCEALERELAPGRRDAT